MEQKFTILDLISNHTLSAEVAGFLWEAVAEETSFLTSAIYQNVGKSTLSKAILGLRRDSTQLHYISDNLEVTKKLLNVEKPGGYLVVSEFNPVVVPGYIWGEKSQQVFELVKKGYSLQGCIHADSAEDAIIQLTRENAISDQDVSLIKLVLYIEVFGTTPANAKRRLSQVYEVHYVAEGNPMGHTIFEWDKETDTFIKTSDPHQFATNKENILKKTQILENYVGLGKTTLEDVSKALAEFS